MGPTAKFLVKFIVTIGLAGILFSRLVLNIAKKSIIQNENMQNSEDASYIYENGEAKDMLVFLTLEEIDKTLKNELTDEEANEIIRRIAETNNQQLTLSPK